MTKRLQVLVEDREYREIQRMARARHISIAAWVREALANAQYCEPREPHKDADRKLDVIRAAVRNQLPTADIEQMLAQVESGRAHGDVG